MNRIGIKTGQKGIGFTWFENELGVKTPLQQAAKACFSDPYQTFNNDIFRQDIPLMTDLRRSAILCESKVLSSFGNCSASKDTH